MSESTATKPSERLEADKRTIIDLLDELEVEAIPTTVYRLPSKLPNGGNRPRLTKGVLSTSAQQKDVLHNANKLKNSINYSKTYIRPSMTREKRQLEYELRQEAPREWKS
jgi:hypothetical protein